MKFLDKMERSIGRRIALPNLMVYVVATMLAVFILDTVVPGTLSSYLYFDRAAIFSGQVWRILTFTVLPPDSSVFFIVIALYFYYYIGSTLENEWGASRFTLYYLFGVIGAILAGLVTGYSTNTYLNLSLFFAFASLFPNQEVLLFFILPIKIKYLAWVNWFFFAVSFLFGTMTTRVAILLSLVNYFLFFGKDIILSIKTRKEVRQRRKQFNNDFWR